MNDKINLTDISRSANILQTVVCVLNIMANDKTDKECSKLAEETNKMLHENTKVFTMFFRQVLEVTEVIVNEELKKHQD